MSITGNSGSPINPSLNNWNILGDAPITTSGSASTLTIDIANSRASTFTDPTKTGVCSFNSSQFSVDANGFVSSLSSSAGISTLTGNSGGAISPVLGNIDTLGSGSITIAGSGNTLTTQLTGLTQYNVLLGAGTSTITKIAPSATSGIPLISQGAAANPAFGTVVVEGGGTGATTLTGVLTGNGTSAVTANLVTQNAVVIGGASNAVSSIGVGTNGQVLIGSTGAAPAFSTLTSTGGTVTFTLGAGTLNLEAGGKIITTVFDSSGTYTKASGVTQVLALIWNGGSGGGSGRRGLTTAAGGGGGGANGFGLYWYGPASFFNTNTTVTIGNGGNGGTAIAADTTSGNPGSAGGKSSLGNLTPPASPAGGGGGTATTAAGGAVSGWRVVTLTTPIMPAVNAGIAGGAGGNVTGTSGAVSGGVAVMNYIPSGGGGGSGADSGTARQAGNGGIISAVDGTTLITGGVGGISTGTINGGAGNIGIVVNGMYTGGTGGGGGGGMVAGTAGTGGVGGVPGGGGGGGGGSINGTASGAGGAGGKGRIVIIEFS